jgi:sn-glycerol 3-phosphate transport system permease protein
VSAAGLRAPLLETAAAWLLALLWLSPLLYAFWAAFPPAEYATRLELLAPLSVDNFAKAC